MGPDELKSSWDEWRDYEISWEKFFYEVLELCCFEWFQNVFMIAYTKSEVLELCCFEWFQNRACFLIRDRMVLELCCFEWFQNYD